MSENVVLAKELLEFKEHPDLTIMPHLDELIYLGYLATNALGEDYITVKGAQFLYDYRETIHSAKAQPAAPADEYTPHEGDVNESIFSVGDIVQVNDIPALAQISRINWFHVWVLYSDKQRGCVALDDCTGANVNEWRKQLEYGVIPAEEITLTNKMTPAEQVAYAAKIEAAGANGWQPDEPQEQEIVADALENLRMSYWDKNIEAGEKGVSFPNYKSWLEERVLKNQKFAATEIQRLTAELERERVANVTLTARNRELAEALRGLLVALDDQYLPANPKQFPPGTFEYALDNERLEAWATLNGKIS